MAFRQRKYISEEAALERMIAACERAEHCSYEIETKLFRLGVNFDVRKRVIKELKRLNCIDDNRFGSMYAYSKMTFSGWGRRKIRLGLMQKRIPEDVIIRSLDSLDREEYEKVLYKVASGKSRRLDPNNREENMKLYKSLLARGFESELIGKTLIRIKAERDIERRE